MRRGAPIVLVLAALAAGPSAAHANDLKVAGAQQIDARLSELTMTTPALDFPVSVRVLLPDGYADHPRRRYPVLYLLHGSFDTAAGWTARGDAEAITAGAPLIVVMPAAAGKGNGGGWASDWRNEGRGGPPEWETFTIGQLVPWVDSHLRTRARRGGRAIAGLSMGGFSAMSYAVRHPDLFAAAASFSGAVDTNYLGVQPVIQGETLADGGATPDSIWGPRASDEVYWRGHNPADLAGNLQRMTVSIRTGNGSPGPYDQGRLLTDPIEYGVHDMSVSLHQRLDALGYEHVFDDYGPGTHSWPYWQRDLRAELPRVMATFAEPPPARPRSFAYASIEPSYRIYGWRVAIDRPATELSRISGASARGFALTGSGAATVTTAALYRPRSRHRVRVGSGAPLLMRAGRRGRLRIAVPLGPGNQAQEYSPGTTTQTFTVRVRIA
jgi:S-formylglutathione hydrolase FrmB